MNPNSLHRLGRIAILFLIFLLLAQGASANYTLDSDKVLNISGVRTFPVFLLSAWDEYDNLGESNMSNVLPDFDGEIYGGSFASIFSAGVTNASMKQQYEDLNKSFTLWYSNAGNTGTWGTYINSSSFFAFHLQDEGALNLSQYQTQYNYAKSRFPNKLIIMNHCGRCPWSPPENAPFTNGFWYYSQGTNITDILSWDTYSIGSQSWYYYKNQRPNASTYGYEHKVDGSWFDGENNLSRKEFDRAPMPVWAMMQAQEETGGYYMPTPQELRSETYVALTMNVMGISYYIYNPAASIHGTGVNGTETNATAFSYIRQLSRELHNFSYFLTLPTLNYRWDCNSLSNLTNETCTNTTATVNTTFSPDPIITLTDGSNPRDSHKLNYRLMRNITSGKTYLIVVNKDPNAISNININVSSLSGSMTATTLGLETNGSQASGRNLTVTNGVFTDSFDGYAAHIYEISNATAGGESSNTTAWTISGSGANATWSGNSTTDNLTEDLGDHDIKIGLFADNFDDGNFAWSQAGNTLGTWSVSGGKLVQTTSGLPIYNEIYPNSTNFTNMDVQANINMTTDGGANDETGLVVHRTANGMYTGATTNFDTIRIRWMDAPPHNNRPVLNTSSKSYNLNTIYKFRFRNYNGALKLKSWNTTEPAWSNEVTNTSYLFGSPGIYDTYNSISVDDFIVRGLDNSGNVIVSGNLTTWYNWTSGNITNQIVVNATTPANTNYSVYYRLNNTEDFINLASNQTGNQTISIATKYQNTDVRLQLKGNETATPEVISITYYSQAAEEESTSTVWTTGIGGQFFQNKTIGSNRTCINQGDGSIGIGYLCDNFNDNNTVGWNETGNLNGTWAIHNGVLNQSGAFASYQYWNVTSYENMSIFSKFKEYGNLSSYVDASDLRGNLSRVNANPSWLNIQFSIGSPTQTRAHIYAYNGSDWLVVNNTATKTRYLLDWNYAAFFANGTYFRGYLSNVSHADALSTLLSSGTSSQWLNGTTIQFGGQPNSATTISWDEIRAVELDAQGNQYLQGNYSMNYTVPASQYAKNITVNGTYPAGTNYSLKYRQNGTGNYVSVEGVKTADSTIELPTPYYQSIDIMLEMNASTSDTLWVSNINVGTADSNGLQVPEIISWSNNITLNQSLNISVNVNQSIRFNVTTNQSITTWTWSKTP